MSPVVPPACGQVTPVRNAFYLCPQRLGAVRFLYADQTCKRGSELEHEAPSLFLHLLLRLSRIQVFQTTWLPFGSIPCLEPFLFFPFAAFYQHSETPGCGIFTILLKVSKRAKHDMEFLPPQKSEGGKWTTLPRRREQDMGSCHKNPVPRSNQY